MQDTSPISNNANDEATTTTQTIKQAMILAAGKGTRLRPLTLDTPKPLIDVGGQPLIVWHIRALKAAGIEDIVINTSWLSDKLMSEVGDGSRYGVRIHWSLEDTPLETAGGIAQALMQGYLKEAPFLLVNGDVWTDFDMSALMNYQMNANQSAHLIMVNNPKHNPQGDFAIHNGLAGEHPIGDTPKYTFAGISVIAPRLVEGIVHGQVTPLAPLLKKEMLKFNVTAEVTQAHWIDVGTPERLEEANQYISNLN